VEIRHINIVDEKHFDEKHFRDKTINKSIIESKSVEGIIFYAWLKLILHTDSILL